MAWISGIGGQVGANMQRRRRRPFDVALAGAVCAGSAGKQNVSEGAVDAASGKKKKRYFRVLTGESQPYEAIYHALSRKSEMHV